MAKHYPPAYYRYKKKHATVSVLLTTPTKEALDKARSDKSYSEFIKSLFSENGLFFELLKQKAQIKAASQKQKVEIIAVSQKQKSKIQKLKAEIIQEKKELETERQNFQQEKEELRQNAYKKGKEEGQILGYIQGEKAGFSAGKDEGQKLGYLQGEKAGIEKGRQQGRMFYFGFCSRCGENVFWDLNDPKYIEMLKEIFRSSKSKLTHVECEEKHPNIEYMGQPEFIPYLPATKKA